MIKVSNSKGGTILINQFWEPKPKKWIWRWHAFGLHFAVSNGRIKKRSDGRDYSCSKMLRCTRAAVFEAQGHKCPLCGAEFKDFRKMEAHHVLPWCRFPELRYNKKNIVMLCHDCHKDVHCNPYRNIAMMEDKAKELNINLSERYEF